MNIIEQTLARVPITEGVIGLHLVEVGTGHVLASIEPGSEPGESGEPSRTLLAPPEGASGRPPDASGGLPPGPEGLASAMTDVVQRITSMVAVGGVPDDLEDLVITMTDHHYLVRVVPGFAGTDAFLLLSLDRARSNLALARYLLLTFEAELVA